MCESCIRGGSISRGVYELIEMFNERFEEAQHGNGHIVFADCNVNDYCLGYCLGLPLAANERRFLELLRALPIEVRVPNEDDR